MEVGVGATDLDQHVPPAVGDSSQARLVRTGCRSHEQEGSGLGGGEGLTTFCPWTSAVRGWQCLLLFGRHARLLLLLRWRCGHALCNRSCSAGCQSGVCGKLAWHWAALHSRRGRGWRFTAPQLLDSAYVAAELRSLRTRLTLAGNLWCYAALLRPSYHRWLDERSREQERPSLAPLN